MTWVKLDDHMSEHPKIVQAGPLAAWLHVCALQYASRNLTDGFIPVRAVTTLANFEGVSLHLGSMLDGAIGLGDDVHIGALAETLVDVGLWEPVQDGYQIHDYLDFNPSKADVMAQRRQNADRQAAWKERQRGSNERANGVTTNSSSAPTNTVTNGVNNAPLTPAPYPVPVPVPVTSPEESGDEVPLSAESGRAASAATPPKAVPKHDRLAQVIDLLRDADLEPNVRGQDTKAVKDCRASPADIAATYVAIAREEFGDDFMLRKLSITTACAHVDGWRASQQRQRRQRPAEGFVPHAEGFLGTPSRGRTTRTRGGIFG